MTWLYNMPLSFGVLDATTRYADKGMYPMTMRWANALRVCMVLCWFEFFACICACMVAATDVAAFGKMKLTVCVIAHVVCRLTTMVVYKQLMNVFAEEGKQAQTICTLTNGRADQCAYSTLHAAFDTPAWVSSSLCVSLQVIAMIVVAYGHGDVNVASTICATYCMLTSIDLREWCSGTYTVLSAKL